jgi:hypothetical protein
MERLQAPEATEEAKYRIVRTETTTAVAQ